MGLPVLILGESGTGKSASLRNFKADDLKVINVANKPLPFKNKFESVSTDDYKQIIKEMKTTKKKVIVIDDAQYLMANEFMRRATERGYDKFTEIAQNFWNLVNTVKDLPNDVAVYFMAHIERDANGNEKIKTIGKMLDEKITVEGMFTIVLKTNVTDGQYSFLTQNSGHDTVKSPIGMFTSYAVDNDLKYVDEKIRNYYEVGDFLSDEDMAEIDEMAKKDDIHIDDGTKKKRGRRSAKKEEPEETPKEEKEVEEPNTDGDDGKSSDAGGETTKRRRRKVLEEEREEVKKENESILANANLDEADCEDGTPFEDAEEPELKPTPKRKRRKAEPEEVATEEQPMNEPEEKQEEAAPRRRRRRA